MNKTIATLLLTGACALAGASAQAADGPVCGTGNGQAATGAPIKVGGIIGNAAPGDFSSSADAAAAYFKCVNANGGVHGRPIEYMVENDQWNPELAAQAASKLVEDQGVIALVGNGSFVEMSVNAPYYAKQNIMAMASACAVSECFESSNIVSTNQGPLPSATGATMFAVEELETRHVACITIGIPSVGQYSCGAVEGYMQTKGLQGTSVYVNPAAPDVNSALLEALASGADTMLVHLPAGLGIAVLSAAQEQDLRDAYRWISSTPLYDASVPATLGDYWDGQLYVNAELNELGSTGPDNTLWQAVMDTHADPSDPRDTFSQSGFLSAKYFVQMLEGMDPGQIDDRAAVTQAIRAINGYRSDLMCGPYYVGDADRHMPNHAGIMVLLKDGGFRRVRDCYEYEGAYFEPLLEIERSLGLR